MEIITLPWNDGSGNNIYLDFNTLATLSEVGVSSDPNLTGIPRSRTLCLNTHSDSPYSKLWMTITQAVDDMVTAVFETTLSVYTDTTNGHV